MATGAGPERSASPAPARFGPWRRETRAFVELLAVTGMAIARPTLGILGNNAAIFVTRQTTPAELVALTLLLVLGPPFVLWGVEVVVGLAFPAARRMVHVVLLAGVAGLFVLALLKKQTGLGPALLLVLAVAAGVVAGFLIWRLAPIRLFLRYLAIAPVLFAVLFLTSSSVTAAVFDPDPSAADVTVRDPKRVVMVVFDEFPEMSLLDGNGRVDAELYPNFAALQADSTWYRNATTVAPYTGAAVPAILTGRYRSGSTDVSVAANTPENLFTLLGGTYDMNVHERVTHLCPNALCDTPDRRPATERVSDLVDVSRELWWEHQEPERQPENALSEGGDILGDPQALRTGDRFVRSLRPADRPRLDFLHVELPHQGWHYLPDGRDYLEDATSPGLWWDYTWGSEWAGQLARERHLLQVGAADRLLGDIVTRLRAIDAYDDTMLVVVADHGVAFGTRQPIRGISRDNLAEVLWVPMFVKAPGQAGPAVDDRPARTIDVLPTVAEQVGVRIPWKVDGRPLSAAPREDDDLRVLDWSHSLMKANRRGFVHVDGASEFPKVLAGRAAPAGGPVAQRPYRVGPYGALLGRAAEPLLASTNADATVTLDDPDRFRDVDPDADDVPWVYVAGSVQGDIEGDTPLAVTVDGIVAGLSGVYQDPLKADRRTFWTVLDPAAFGAGDHVMKVTKIEGPVNRPRLVPLRMTG